MSTTAEPAATSPALPVEDRTVHLRPSIRINRWLVLLVSVVAVAIALAVLLLDDPPSATRADVASTARWNEAAAQYEAMRTTRANTAWAARLDAAAAQYEAKRQGAALAADAARLTRQAEVRALR